MLSTTVIMLRTEISQSDEQSVWDDVIYSRALGRVDILECPPLTYLDSIDLSIDCALSQV